MCFFLTPMLYLLMNKVYYVLELLAKRQEYIISFPYWIPCMYLDSAFLFGVFLISAAVAIPSILPTTQ
jgi:hypothetical protein